MGDIAELVAIKAVSFGEESSLSKQPDDDLLASSLSMQLQLDQKNSSETNNKFSNNRVKRGYSLRCLREKLMTF